MANRSVTLARDHYGFASKPFSEYCETNDWIKLKSECTAGRPTMNYQTTIVRATPHGVVLHGYGCVGLRPLLSKAARTMNCL